MAFALVLLMWPLNTGTRFDELVVALAGAAAGLAVYIGMAHWLGISELREATSRVMARIRPSGAA
jgi:hypothetical protein